MFITTSNSRKRYQRALLRLESLEPRTLLSATVSTVLVDNVFSQGGAYDSSGHLWVYNLSPNGASLDEIDTAGQSVLASIPLDGYSPHFFAAGPNGLIYISDYASAIDVVDTNSLSVAQYPVSLPGELPGKLTVTGNGAVWFLGTGNGVSFDLGRFDPVSHAVTTSALDAFTADSVPNAIASNGPDSVWVGLAAAQDSNTFFITGTNQVLSVSFNGAITVNNSFSAAASNPVSANTQLTSIVGAADGSVWFSLSHNPFVNATTPSPDTLVHASADGTAQTFTAIDDATSALNVTNLVLDANGNVWFNELAGSQFGYFDGTSPTFIDNPVGPTFGQYQAFVNPAGTQISMITQIAPDDFNTYSAYPIITVDIASDVVSFSGSATDLSGREDSALPFVATFTSPTPSTAVINWGDSTASSPATLTLISSDNGYTYTIATSKTYATQGTHNGSVVVSNSNGTVGQLTFTSTIGDIPLNVTSLTATPLILRITTVVATFTDDGDLPLSTWTTTINWGDNTTSTGVIIRDPTQPGRYFVLALHQYRTRGPYTITFKVTTSESLAAVTNSQLTTSVVVR